MDEKDCRGHSLLYLYSSKLCHWPTSIWSTANFILCVYALNSHAQQPQPPIFSTRLCSMERLLWCASLQTPASLLVFPTGPVLCCFALFLLPAMLPLLAWRAPCRQLGPSWQEPLHAIIPYSWVQTCSIMVPVPGVWLVKQSWLWWWLSFCKQGCPETGCHCWQPSSTRRTKCPWEQLVEQTKLLS